MATEKKKLIEHMDRDAQAFGLPTYSALQAALNELATYVQQGVSADAIKASADRARALSTFA